MRRRPGIFVRPVTALHEAVLRLVAKDRLDLLGFDMMLDRKLSPPKRRAR